MGVITAPPCLEARCLAIFQCLTYRLRRAPGSRPLASAKGSATTQMLPATQVARLGKGAMASPKRMKKLVAVAAGEVTAGRKAAAEGVMEKVEALRGKMEALRRAQAAAEQATATAAMVEVP